jgi:PAS domain S-box-containing protein
MPDEKPFEEPAGKHASSESSGALPLMDENNLIQLARSLDHTPGTVMLGDPSGQITFINKGLSVLSGFKPQEMIGQSMTSFWNQTPETTQGMMAQLYSGHVWQGEIQHKKKNGLEFFELASISIIMDGEGLITGFFKLGQDISDQKTVQDTVGLREQGSGAVFDFINAGYVETDLQGMITYANKRASSIYRRPAKALKNLSPGDYMPREESERIVQILNDVFRKGGRSRETIGYQVIGKDGSLVDCEAVIALLRNTKGQPAGFGCVVRDVTETKKIEAALKESEESYRKLINMAPYSITINRASDGGYLLVNRAFLQRTGFTREEVIGRTVRELNLYLNVEDRVRLEDLFRRQGRIDDFEMAFKTKDGAITEVLLSARPILFNGEPCNLFMSTNIDALKKAQRELMESEENARRIIETAPYSIVITRLSDLRYVQVNNAFCLRTGYTREETIGKTSVEQNIYADTSVIERIIDAFVKDGKVDGMEIQHRAKDGHILESLSSITPIRFKGEDCLMTISADLTERKRAERELEQYRMHLEEMVKDRTQALEDAQAELVKREKLSVLGQLTATVSHELRNPLGVIRTSAFYVQRKMGEGDEKILKHLRRIEEQVQICDTIVDDLLEYTRGRNVSIVMEDLTPLLKEVVRHTQATKSVNIMRDWFKVLPPVPHDPEKMRRVMINILENAAQAVREKQQAGVGPDTAFEPGITIATRTEDDHVAIEVADNGVGMNAETLERAFEPLFTTRARGTGIGLANVKKIIDEHHGRIFMESKPGKGTKITILMPCDPDRKQ